MERLLYEVKKVIVGQDHLLERLIVALLARGHILVPARSAMSRVRAPSNPRSANTWSAVARIFSRVESSFSGGASARLAVLVMERILLC
jgi:hypothetical protein